MERQYPITSFLGAAGAALARTAGRSLSTLPPSRARADTRLYRTKNTRDWQTRPNSWEDCTFIGTGFECCRMVTPTMTGWTSSSDEQKALTTTISLTERCSGRWRLMQTGIAIYGKRRGEKDSRRTRRIVNSGRYFRTSFSRWQLISFERTACTPRRSISGRPSSQRKRRRGSEGKNRSPREGRNSRLA